MILNFKCYSQKNRDFHEVYYGEKRFRGCKVGDPIIVAGYDIRQSEENLKVIKAALMQIPNSEVLINRAGSFSIEIKTSSNNNMVYKPKTPTVPTIQPPKPRIINEDINIMEDLRAMIKWLRNLFDSNKKTYSTGGYQPIKQNDGEPKPPPREE